MVKLAPNGHVSIKMLSNNLNQLSEASEGVASSDWMSADNKQDESGAVTGENEGNIPSSAVKKPRNIGINLFADSNVPSSFRRLSFSPDGSLLIVPAGVYRPQQQQQLPSSSTTGGTKASPSLSASSSSVNSVKEKDNNNNTSAQSYCTHIFKRGHFSTPVLSLMGPDDPSVAIRCCPRLFKLMKNKNGSEEEESLFEGKYRMIFAVITITSILIYDTQHPFPLLKLRGLHYAPMNDATWSSDGRMLTICSSDGYLTFLRFHEGLLGEFLEEELVPDIVKISHPAFYGILPSKNELMVKNGEPISSTSSSASSSVVVGNDVADAVTMAVSPLKKSEAIDVIVKQTPSSELTVQNEKVLQDLTFPSSSSLSPVKLTTTATDDNTAGKKRKRIQPEKIEMEGPLASVVAPHPSFSPEKKQKVFDLTPQSALEMTEVVTESVVVSLVNEDSS
jgi:hypothetical protein